MELFSSLHSLVHFRLSCVNAHTLAPCCKGVCVLSTIGFVLEGESSSANTALVLSTVCMCTVQCKTQAKAGKTWRVLKLASLLCLPQGGVRFWYRSLSTIVGRYRFPSKPMSGGMGRLMYHPWYALLMQSNAKQCRALLCITLDYFPMHILI